MVYISIFVEAIHDKIYAHPTGACNTSGRSNRHFLSCNHDKDAHLHSTLQWRHNGHGGVSNHQPHHCLFNRLFKAQIKENIKLRVTGLGAGNSPVTMNSPNKWPVMRWMFPFDIVIMRYRMVPVSSYPISRSRQHYEYEETFFRLDKNYSDIKVW